MAASAQEDKPIPPGVNRIKKKLADGSVRFYYYHRATDIRLPDDPESLAFRVALKNAEREADGLRDDGGKSLSWLIREYEKSSDWKRLAESTKTIARFDLKAIEDKFGALPLAALSERGMRGVLLGWHDELAEKHPKAADAKMTRLAKVLAFGFDREHIPSNPIATFKRVYSSDRSDKLWLPEHVAAFNAAAHPLMRLALFVALHSGQRRGDLLALQWENYDGEALSIRQSKTGADVFIPCTAALRSTLDDLKATREEEAKASGSKLSPFVLLNTRGEPYTAEGFHTQWDRSFDLAWPRWQGEGEARTKNPARPDLHFHDARGTAVTMLAEAGCTEAEIATITGHSIKTVSVILERYLSRTKSLARSAIAKLELRLAA